MRGAGGDIESMPAMSRPDNFVPANHPMRPILLWLNEALAGMDGILVHLRERRKGRPSEHRAAEADSRAAVARAVIDSQRTHIDGANLQQYAVSLVPRTRAVSTCLGPFVEQSDDDIRTAALWDHSTVSKNRDAWWLVSGQA